MSLSDATFAASEQHIGRRGAVDLVAVQGYHETVYMTLERCAGAGSEGEHGTAA